MVVWLFPYLPLGERMTIGPWTLIPRASLENGDATSPAVAEQARGLAALYRMPGNDRGFGAFVRSQAAPVGDEVDELSLGRLYQSVVTALLDKNPVHVDPDPNDYNAGQGVCTTENARLHGHGVDDDGYTAFSYGVMVEKLVGGYQVGLDEARIEPPHELHLPMRRRQIDDVYASALYEVLSHLSGESPDLPGAIRWLEVGWSNSLSVRPEARILALRAGFDVLFGGAQTHEIREKLGALLDPPAAPRTAREWDDHRGNHRGPIDLTDLEWWFQSFALLRNKIAHGGQLQPGGYDFDDGIGHIWHAEHHLRRAIKKIVADAGHEDVLLEPLDRVVRHHANLILEDFEREEGNG